MSGQTVPADFSEHMLDLDEDEDLEVFSKVKEAEEGRAKAEANPQLQSLIAAGGYVDLEGCRQQLKRHTTVWRRLLSSRLVYAGAGGGDCRQHTLC